MRRLLRCCAAVAISGLLAAADEGGGGGGGNGLLGLLTEQLIVIATVAGAVAVMPELFEWLANRRRRRENLALSIEQIDLRTAPVRAAGHAALIEANRDILDAMRLAESHPTLGMGNELLIIGPPMSGRKSLALLLGQTAGISHCLIVHNAANADALAWVRDRIARSKPRLKWLLVIPHIDRVHATADDDELLSQLESLIESSSERRNVLVIGTASNLEPDAPLDNLFGVKLLMPGVTPDEIRPVPRHADAVAYHRSVAEHYADRISTTGVAFHGLDRSAWIDRVVEVVGNPAEVEDIANLCLTTALYRARTSGVPAAIDETALQRAISRVIVGACHAGPHPEAT